MDSSPPKPVSATPPRVPINAPGSMDPFPAAGSGRSTPSSPKSLRPPQWDSQHELDKKSWEVDRLGMMTENAQLTEQKDDSDIKLKHALREIEHLKGLLGSKDAEVESAKQQALRARHRLEELAREEVDEQDKGMAALEHELSVAKHQLAEAQDEIEGLKFLVEETTKDNEQQLERSRGDEEDESEEIEVCVCVCVCWVCV